MRTRGLFWLPLILVGRLVKVVAVPTALVALAWWLTPDPVATGVTVAAVVYLAGVAVLAGAELRGRIRSMARGTFTIRDEARRRRHR